MRQADGRVRAAGFAPSVVYSVRLCNTTVAIKNGTADPPVPYRELPLQVAVVAMRAHQNPEERRGSSRNEARRDARPQARSATRSVGAVVRPLDQDRVVAGLRSGHRIYREWPEHGAGVQRCRHCPQRVA
jgi:hypothetical protein